MLIDADWGCPFGTAALFLRLSFFSLYFAKAAVPARHIRYVTQNWTYKKLWFPLLDSRPSPFHWALDVWWSNPDIFYILMQNKQSQITHILPPHWFVEVVNQIKLPFLFLSFRLTRALGGSVLAGTLNRNSLEHRASFVVRPFFFLQGVCEKEQDFLSWAQVPPSLHCCLSGALCPGLLW